MADRGLTSNPTSQGYSMLPPAKQIVAAAGGGGSVITLTGSRSLNTSDNAATLFYGGSDDILVTIAPGLQTGFSCSIFELGLGKVVAKPAFGVGADNLGSTQGINTFLTIVQVGVEQYQMQNPVPAGPVTLYQSALPPIFVSSWSFAANGALTLTALNTTYPNAYLYFPADAIYTGCPAGWYYTEMSSTTAGIVYNNRYVSGKPVIPASKTPFVCTAGSVTAQVTTAVVGPNFTVPGGSVGPNGLLEARALWLTNNSGNTKAGQIRLETAVLTSLSASGSNVAYEVSNILQNTGSQTRQIVRSSQRESLTGVPSWTAVDTSVDTNFNTTFTLATPATGDYIILERMHVNQQYGAA